jgi:thioredoxin reductase/biotin carboxylase
MDNRLFAQNSVSDRNNTSSHSDASMNVLFTCAGRRSFWINAFKETLNNRGQVFACDSSPEAPALQAADKAFIVPQADAESYIEALLEICREHGVRLLIPALESELPHLAEHRSRFSAIGTVPLVSSPEVIAICYDKLETAKFLTCQGLSAPRTYSSLETAREALARGEIAFPLVIKPRWGVSSIGLEVAEDDQELELAFKAAKRQIARTFLAEVSATAPEHSILIQEHLSGDEYGLDIINNFQGRHACTFVKRKLRMRAGQTDRAVTVKDEKIEQIGRLIGEKLGHIGILDCDLFVGEKGCHIIDLNPRIGGGYPFSHMAGANLPAAFIAWLNGGQPDPKCFEIEPNLTVSRSDEYVVICQSQAPLDNHPRAPRTPAAIKTRMRNQLTHRVAIIGAGPYGLAAAAHLRAAQVESCIFGKAMEFWENQMPDGMFLRSSWEASHIADPSRRLTLDHFQSSRNIRLSKPIPLDGFVDYGRWFQQQVAPDLDARRITRIERVPKGFNLTLEDVDSVQVERVVVATGIAPFTLRPREFDGLPRELVSHTSEHQNLSQLGCRKIVIVGGGQSALESAALLAEAGAEVEVIVRRSVVHWLDQNIAWLKSEGNPLRPLFYPSTDVGPPGLNWIVATPGVFKRLPFPWQEKIAYRSIRPAGAGWLRPRVGAVRITTGRCIISAASAGERIRLKLDDGSERCVDHALLATGFRVDISRYNFLAPELLSELRVADGYPVLGLGFESSVPGLHFLGAPAARSFGPVCRFVSGTTYSARALAKRIASKPAVQWNLF